MNALNNDIIGFLRENPSGVPARTIAERFLKFKNPPAALAENAVNAILSKDARARVENNLWTARRSAAGRLAPRVGGVEENAERDVAEMPWATVLVTADAERKSIAHISVWSVFPAAACEYAAWLKDPKELSPEDRDALCDPRDQPFDRDGANAAVEHAARILADKTPVFFSQRQYSIFARAAQNHGTGIDDYYLTNQLLRAAKETECKPLTLENIAAATLGYFRTEQSAYRQGELFCRAAAEIINKMKPAGVETRAHLDAALDCGVSADPASNITARALASLPYCAGVYGFTDKSGAYLYIGKAANLRRRVENYFRFNSESPEKLTKLRAAARDLTIHRCESELEALIYEYRLIKKHRPPLNSQVEILERRGACRPLDDMIIPLSQSQDGICASVWVKRDQKIKLRRFELGGDGDAALLNELREYFYAGKLAPMQTDFAELEIVTRWLKRYRDDVQTIPIANYANAEEVLAALKSSFIC